MTKGYKKRASKGASLWRRIGIAMLRLINRMRGKRHFRLGSCSRCGGCCRQMRLLYNGRVINRLEDYHHLLESDPSFAIFKPSAVGERPLTFTCIHVNAQGLCGNYAGRPESCRIYPDGDQIRGFSGDMIEGCGYELIPVESFDAHFSRALKKGE
jgi:Fe-S-cluster containining protein